MPCRSIGRWRSSPDTAAAGRRPGGPPAGPAGSVSERSEATGPGEVLPVERRLDLVLAPVADLAVSQVNDRDAVVLPVAAEGVFGGADVSVDDEVMPSKLHRRRIVTAEELEQLLSSLVALLVGRFHVDGVLGEELEGPARVAGDPTP